MFPVKSPRVQPRSTWRNTSGLGLLIEEGQVKMALATQLPANSGGGKPLPRRFLSAKARPWAETKPLRSPMEIGHGSTHLDHLSRTRNLSGRLLVPSPHTTPAIEAFSFPSLAAGSLLWPLAIAAVHRIRCAQGYPLLLKRIAFCSESRRAVLESSATVAIRTIFLILMLMLRLQHCAGGQQTSRKKSYTPRRLDQGPLRLLSCGIFLYSALTPSPRPAMHTHIHTHTQAPTHSHASPGTHKISSGCCRLVGGRVGQGT